MYTRWLGDVIIWRVSTTARNITGCMVAIRLYRSACTDDDDDDDDDKNDDDDENDVISITLVNE